MAKRVGRPKVQASERRNAIMRFVVTKAEAEKIRAEAKTRRVTLSDYLRSVAIP
jgi:hypothetical protein